jgi:alpha-mannosidase
VAKLVFPVGGNAADRLDGIPGGGARRPQDGRECPLVDWTIARRRDGHSLAVASPDCSALDGTADSLRFTLLRSPAYAWHDPAKLPGNRVHRFIDQGEHGFRFALVPDAGAAAVNALALAFHRPPVCVDWTRGMTPQR